MEVPWGMIQARREAAGYAQELKYLQRKLDKALELLKMNNPDVKKVIKILEEKPPKVSF